MSFSDRLSRLLLQLICAAVAAFFLAATGTQAGVVLILLLSLLLVFLAVQLSDFFRQRARLRELDAILNGLEQKYLFTECAPPPRELYERRLFGLTRRAGRAMVGAVSGPQAVQRRVREVAQKLGITDILEKFPYQVSGGQKQRAACARAMVVGQSLLLADEPTGALDSRASKNLLEIMTRMNRAMGATILMVTHDAYSVSYAGRVLFLKDGRVFNELLRGNRGRPVFYHEILDVLAALGGDVSDVI